MAELGIFEILYLPHTISIATQVNHLVLDLG